MSINNYSNLTRIVSHINNPNLQLGTLIEEIPTDIGRCYQGYKRGGIIEGAEKLRKEVMGAVVWIFGIPVFNKLGNKFFENVLKIPTSIDYSNASKGKDSIKNSINYLTQGLNPENLDVSELAKYGDKFKGMNPEELIKQTRYAKRFSSLSAVVLNCLAMGILIPKVNQALTRKKLEGQNKKTSYDDKLIISMDSFKNSIKNKDKTNQPSFTGALDFITYCVENNNTFRLMATDGPMITGRMATSRNKYEALEFLVIDGGSVYFYNFCSKNIQSLIRKFTKIPYVNSKVAELLKKLSPDEVENALKNKNPKDLFEILDSKLATDIYTEGTFGKYGKINKFIKDSDLKTIDNDVLNTLNYIKNSSKDGKIDANLISQTISKINKTNSISLAIGLAISIFGLAVFIPKLAFKITEKLTGKNEFTGIADYSDENKKA